MLDARHRGLFRGEMGPTGWLALHPDDRVVDRRPPGHDGDTWQSSDGGLDVATLREFRNSAANSRDCFHYVIKVEDTDYWSGSKIQVDMLRTFHV